MEDFNFNGLLMGFIMATLVITAAIYANKKLKK